MMPLLVRRIGRFSLFLVLLAGPLLSQKTDTHQGKTVAANEVLVKIRRPSLPTLLQIQATHDLELDELVGGFADLHRFRSRSQNVAALIAALSKHPEVAYVEPNYIVRGVALPNDSSYNQLWGMQNIAANAAWDISTGSTANVIAVVDTGIDYTHADLAANVWSAPASFTVTIGGRAITCAAGTHGFNAIKKTCDPKDDNQHGTHVSGTIGAAGNNSLGVTGVNWTARMMGLKFLAADGSGTIADGINAIEFAIQTKAAFAATGTPVNIRVLSASWGSTSFSQALLDEINKANSSDMLFVAAAGNSSSNNDVTPTYPASFQAPNVIAVAANDNPDSLAWFSNYGATSVHLAAPGAGILSTLPGGTYGALDGTSMATPHVSGAALLVLARCPMNTASLKSTLLGNVDPVPALAGTTLTGGRLNVDKALRSCTGTPPQYAVSFTPSAVGPGGTVTVSWSVPTGQAANDWVGLFQAGAPNTTYGWYKFTNGAGTGSATLTAPTQTGQYEFRYLIENGYADQARSAALTVSASIVSPSVSSVQATNVTSTGATITWTTNVASDSQVDYGLTTAYGSSSTLDPSKVTSHAVTLAGLAASTTYHYRVRSTDAGGAVAVSGDSTFTTLVSSAGFSVAGSPATVSPGGSLTVSWTAPAGRPVNDWVGLFAVGAPNTASLWYTFTNGTTSGSATATAPSQPGQYEFRYLLQNGYSDIVRSSAITVSTASFAVTASPASVGPGGTWTVSWTVPAGRPANDWVGLFAVGAANTSSLWYAYTNGAPTGSLTVTAPSQVGSYEFRYLLQNGYTDAARSSTVTVVLSGNYAVSAAPVTVGPGGTWTVSWSAPSGRPANDWVGLFAAGAPNTTYLWYAFTGGSTSGSLTVTAPTQTGQYEFRYLLQNGYTDAARSSPVTVAAAAVTISAVQSSNVTSSAATITWTTNAPADSQVEYGPTTAYGSSTAVDPAQVTAHSAGLTNLAASTLYHYRVKSGGAVSGDNTFTTLASNAGYTLAATPSSVSLGGTLTVAWTAPSGRPANDWIGLFAAGAPNTTYVWFAFTNGAASGSFTVTAPSQAGQYEFRYLQQNGYTDVARSNTATVGSSGYTLAASPSTLNPGGALTVSWTAPAGRPTNDWIGLFAVGSSNNSAVWWQYTNGATSGSFTPQAPSTLGQYEFRYLLQNGYTDATRSNIVTVDLSGNYALTASPSTASPGGALTVSWTAPSGRPTNDWVGLFAVGAPNTTYVWYAFTNGATTGTLTVAAPAQTGQYEFRYLLQNGYTSTARSGTVTVQ